MLTDNTEINGIFKNFYENVYRSDMPVDRDRYAEFFSNIEIPVVSKIQVDTMDTPIDKSEVRDAILSMRSRKSPGLDGFPAEYYKTNIHVLAPILTKL